ncbi:hypothetical protein [Marinobacter sp. HN1S83]|uniref:hypothetical protein n=1 Tax=Marinobacter sp. HN1S83 TaxID=3382301 RepID=UPI00387B52A9
MYSRYFDDWEVRPEFEKEFISLFDGWLGEENLHKLDEITKAEWERFNVLLGLVCEQYEAYLVDSSQQLCHKVVHPREVLQSYEEAMEKDSSNFIRLVIPELDCLLTEDWDYTYVLWYKNDESVSAMRPLISQAVLHHFGAETT